MNFLRYNGKSSADFGIYISGSGTYNSPKKSYTTQKIPGRAGDFLTGEFSYENIAVTYPIFIRQNFSLYAEKAINWLYSGNGYAKLEDTYHPEYFRKAYVESNIEFTMRALNRAGEANLVFNCKPFRYLRQGEISLSFSEKTILFNEQTLTALPYFKIYGSGDGSLTVNEKEWSFSEIDQFIEIDSETGNFHKGTVSMNLKVIGDGFPELTPGKNTIAFSGNITKIEVKPRWCAL